MGADIRHYTRLAANGVLALRFKAQKSWGQQPDFMYFGGNSELRGYDYLQFIGHKAFFANAELRFPLIDAMLTPFGVLGGLRGVFFARHRRRRIQRPALRALDVEGRDLSRRSLGYRQDALGNLTPVYGHAADASPGSG